MLLGPVVRSVRRRVHARESGEIVGVLIAGQLHAVGRRTPRPCYALRGAGRGCAITRELGASTSRTTGAMRCFVEGFM